ncbi:MAG: DNA polymerase IV [Coriobacteriales bacterium]|jgi:DNA polymerase-4|nr:DNA polymerase IV [Coriobacteriales bacterium]
MKQQHLRHILHCDANSFYASVEQAVNPELRGKPVVVGGNEEKRKGIVLTKSKEAKAYGIQTAETLWQARQKCPDLIVVPPNFVLYKKYSTEARKIYYQYTDLVEPYGLDEAWLDVTNSQRLFGTGEDVARKLSAQIKNELGITVSIGVSWNKIFAKFGSDYKKPDAITVISEDNYREIVWAAPVRELFFVGRQTERKLKELGIHTVGDLAREAPENMQQRFGVVGATLSAFARGEDDTPVKPFDPKLNNSNHVIKTYGNGLTSPHDITTPQDAKALIYLLAESVAQRMREDGARAKTISVWTRYANLQGCMRQAPLPFPSAATSTVARTAWEILRSNEPLDSEHPIRALSVRASDLVDASAPTQLSLFDDAKNESLEVLDSTVDTLRKRFGNTVVQRGIELSDDSYSDIDIKRDNIML